MASSGFSNRSSRADDSFAGFRGRFGGSGSGRDDERYGGYRRSGQDYDRGYREPVGSPYDDIDDVSGIGEVRTRAVANDRYHPPLLSFKEARRNTYVGDRFRYDAHDRQRVATRRFEHPSASYTPRVRDSVNVGYSSEYNDEVASPAPAAASAAAGMPASSEAQVAGARPAGEEASSAHAYGMGGKQPVSASGRPLSASGFDPFASFQRTGAPSRSSKRRLKVLAPTEYGQAADVARSLKAGDAVVLMLAQVPTDLAKRILDFSFGAASALDAGVECVAERVFVLARGQGLSESERTQLRSQGIIE